MCCSEKGLPARRSARFTGDGGIFHQLQSAVRCKEWERKRRKERVSADLLWSQMTTACTQEYIRLWPRRPCHFGPWPRWWFTIDSCMWQPIISSKTFPWQLFIHHNLKIWGWCCSATMAACGACQEKSVTAVDGMLITKKCHLKFVKLVVKLKDIKSNGVKYRTVKEYVLY